MKRPNDQMIKQVMMFHSALQFFERRPIREYFFGKNLTFQ